MSTSPVAKSNADARDLIAPITTKGFLKDRSIAADCALPEIAKLVAEGRIVILKDVFDPAMLIGFRHALNQWAKRTALFPHGKSASALTDTNYHRIDDGTITSRTPHIFHQFGFSRFDTLEDQLRGPAELISQALTELQNSVAGTQVEFSATGFRLKVLHYPAGGGFLVEHTHPYQPQCVGLIASMSRIGTDFTQGATSFETPFGRVDARDYHDIGDIILFRYDLPHAVRPVDADQQMDWDSDAGKWSIVLELRGTHANTNAITTAT